jgi:ribosomal protein S24E
LTCTFGDYSAKHSIQRHLTVSYTLQQNSVVERHNQTVFGMAKSMLKAKGMSG